MDDRIQDLINGMAGHAGLLDDAMKLLATGLIFLAVPLMLILWFWPANAPQRALNQRVAGAAVAAVMLALGVASLAGHAYADARPFVSDPGTRLLVQHSANNSFPSDHATVSFAIAGTIIWWRRLAGGLVMFAAALIGLARVFVGVHWPSDILGGAIIGLAVGSIAALSVPRLTCLQRWAARYLPPWLIAPP